MVATSGSCSNETRPNAAGVETITVMLREVAASVQLAR